MYLRRTKTTHKVRYNRTYIYCKFGPYLKDIALSKREINFKKLNKKIMVWHIAARLYSQQGDHKLTLSKMSLQDLKSHNPQLIRWKGLMKKEVHQQVRFITSNHILGNSFISRLLFLVLKKRNFLFIKLPQDCSMFKQRM